MKDKFFPFALSTDSTLQAIALPHSPKRHNHNIIVHKINCTPHWVMLILGLAKYNSRLSTLVLCEYFYSPLLWAGFVSFFSFFFLFFFSLLALHSHATKNPDSSDVSLNWRWWVCLEKKFSSSSDNVSVPSLIITKTRIWRISKIIKHSYLYYLSSFFIIA